MMHRPLGPRHLSPTTKGESTPTVTSGSGSITSYTSALDWVRVGALVFFVCTITITNNGTGATNLQFTLPFTAAQPRTPLYGHSFTGGFALTGYISTTTALVLAYNATYPAATGHSIEVCGVYEV